MAAPLLLAFAARGLSNYFGVVAAGVAVAVVKVSINGLATGGVVMPSPLTICSAGDLCAVEILIGIVVRPQCGSGERNAVTEHSAGVPGE